MSKSETTIRKALKIGGIGLGVIAILFVMLIEVAVLQQWARDYRASIVRDTVEALKHQ